MALRPKFDAEFEAELLKIMRPDMGRGLLDDIQDVDLEEIALATSGAVGSDLANMINEAAIVAVKNGRKEVSQKDLEMVFNYFPRLKERRKQIAGTLSGGEQQMLAMSRALMSHPKLMMLDEPSMGLAPILVDQIFDIIRELHKAGTTILLVEQNARKALQVADRAYVLETGGITLTGTGAELAVSDEVRKAYLGG